MLGGASVLERVPVAFARRTLRKGVLAGIGAAFVYSGSIASALKWFPDRRGLAAGIIAGHIIECGAQCSGGNCLIDWQNIPDLANVGYPIVNVPMGNVFGLPVTGAVPGARVMLAPEATAETAMLLDVLSGYEVGDATWAPRPTRCARWRPASGPRQPGRRRSSRAPRFSRAWRNW